MNSKGVLLSANFNKDWVNMGDIAALFVLLEYSILKGIGRTLGLTQLSHKFRASLRAKLNKLPSDPSAKVHAQTRLARKVARELTLDDAKVALSKGWNVEHLKSLNPNLSEKEIESIFENTLKLLLEIRETQKRTRIINAANTVLKADATSPLWQVQVANLLKSAQEKSHFDPYDQPVLLLAETEYNLALWSDQIPAITRLAPRQQVSALVELAMGLGKTDVISPAVLCLLADGTTLPILVMPESLVPSVAARLQERIKQGFNMEIRVIPIDRGDWNVERITGLHKELVTMKDQRIPLIWSSTDIQTLINSCKETYVEINKQATQTPDDFKKIEAWKNLFSFMRSTVEILGDEIHVILDYLTAYSFSLGMPEPLDIDEMDAVADFVKVVFSHPDIADKVSLLGKNYGTPLTKEYFTDVLAPKIIKTLMDRGIINDPQSKEVFDQLKPHEKAWIQNYLSSSPHTKELKEHRFFPVIDTNLLQNIKNNNEIKDENDEDIAKILSSVLSIDKQRLAGAITNSNFINEAKKIIEGYQWRETRVHNFLATQKESLRIVFPLTAMAQKDKHYVLNEEGNSAIPADNGTPLWDAQFGTTLERLYYSTFLFSQQKISRDIIRQDLEIYTKKYQTQMTTLLEGQDLEGIDLAEFLLNNPFVKEFEERYGKLCPFVNTFGYVAILYKVPEVPFKPTFGLAINGNICVLVSISSG